MKNFWTIVGVVVSVIVAWWLVNVLFSVIALAIKLIIVAVFAAFVFFLLRSLLSKSRAE